MFELTCRNLSWDRDLQLIHADVRLAAEGCVWIEEPLCIDVGLPALLLSLTEDVEPDRWADPKGGWKRMPFFVCGCGDPECRAYSFSVKHLPGGEIRLAQVEERQGRPYRELESLIISKKEYGQQVLDLAKQYLAFTDGLEYRPYFSACRETVKKLYDLAKSQL
jgi:hypothetical protein